MKSVPEQVWYAKALPVGDGSLKLRKLRNAALASRKLVGAGWARSSRIVPVDDSGVPFAVGDQVMGNFCDNGGWYAGIIAGATVNSENETVFDLTYDDGDCESAVPSSRIRRRVPGATGPPEFAEGAGVEANYGQRGVWCPGTVAAVVMAQDGTHTYTIAYDDGKSESNVHPQHMRVESSLAAAAASVTSTLSSAADVEQGDDLEVVPVNEGTMTGVMVEKSSDADLGGSTRRHGWLPPLSVADGAGAGAGAGAS